ncbi:25-hydroxyvitamin D-1 alpha hydroxylase, mitochondrial [Nerophis lumbriciformis]|uniref:25-hydroxyvitamin D-1 alpha hydroxylase, mitochondrial n=1 Tax=Nerophis lumbriciformis TaxID=546530 RepID=UPI002AE05067|nr:25-hydroxyvitamin D-1 alpha hydroxylase, mitochondrial-like [Nerophis lumbriciformis]
MISVRRRMQRAWRGSGRSATPLPKCVGRWAEGDGTALRTLDDMPGPLLLSSFWELFPRRGLTRMHQLQLEGLQRYGPMWKTHFGPILTVHVAQPALIEQVLRQEGKYPCRSDLSSWKDYRKLRGHHYGLLTSEGKEWQEVRSLLSKHMLRPKAVEAYDKTLNGVVSDLIAKLRLRRLPGGLVTDVAKDFYFFGLEGISSVLFESRIGCLDPVVPKETEHFIQCINCMFLLTLPTMAMPRWLHTCFPIPWRLFCYCWDNMFKFAKGQIDKLLKDVANNHGEGKVEGHCLAYHLSQTTLPMETVYSNITELLLAGVDTISSTFSWSLYELSRHPEMQASLRQEVLAVLEGKAVPEAADVARMPLLKATIKEVLRLYPVIPANARVNVERDIQVGGYVIPKNTLITLCQFATSRDPSVFPCHNDFLPRRWLNKGKTHHPYASLPFGVGKRSCIGRRIAELELYLALARILVEFDVRPDPEGVSVKPKTRTLLVPAEVINLQFVER